MPNYLLIWREISCSMKVSNGHGIRAGIYPISLSLLMYLLYLLKFIDQRPRIRRTFITASQPSCKFYITNFVGQDLCSEERYVRN